MVATFVKRETCEEEAEATAVGNCTSGLDLKPRLSRRLSIRVDPRFSSVRPHKRSVQFQ